MKPHLFFSLLTLGLLLVLTHAFEKEDHEIFRLRDEVAEAEGPDVTFYDLVGVSSSASNPELRAALRKKSVRLHPDKAIPSLIAKREAKKHGEKKNKSGVKVTKGISQKERAKITTEANERYARLKNVQNVLLGEARERYDYFLKNGFPTWKGTGYYYARFRPGLGSVLLGLMVVFGGLGHYGAMYISWKRQREFVQRYVTHARKMAWGNEMGPGIPGIDGAVATATATPPQEDSDEPYTGALNRRQKRMQEKESKKKENGRAVKTARTRGISRPVDGQPIEGPQGSRKKVVAENGKILIVDSAGDVYLEDETAEGEKHQFLLDPDEIPKPTIWSTALFRLPMFLFNQSAGRVIDKVRGTSDLEDENFLDEEGEELTVMDSNANGDATLHTATSVNSNEEMRKRKSKARR